MFTTGTGPLAPQVSGPVVGGGKLALTGYRGHVVVLNFWGSWCTPCREEAPDLSALAAHFTSSGVRFLGIDIRDSPPSAQAFMRDFRITYPSLNDPGDNLALNFRSTVPPAGIPTTLVISRQGRITARVIGQVTYDGLKSAGPAGRRGARMTLTPHAPTPGGDPMTGLRVPGGACRGRPGAGRCGAGPRGPARPQPEPLGPHRVGPLGLAPAHLDAHRAGAAVPAGRGQRAGVAPAAAGNRPGRRAAVLHLAPGAGALAGPAVAVQRVRGALVRGDLPAAVPVPGGLRDTPRRQAGPLGPDPAAARPAEPGPAAPVRPAREHPRPGRRPGRRRGPAAPPQVPAAHR